ncbi:hypothetical protein BC477_11785 [Clavibacter michiganensis subsp. michiganensis]|uniref:Uncharacterized protein n=1 Tax=Clavibacter michiganensis subsp. michiganensis TaxID=33013 RepID=A0A251XHB7_CLAMM|nr:hypothetical protein BC477_11785 [Clavibacter michiganensis subsp. michiganensis]OUE02475.1 hypothetical protein CMMCAS07_10695 [Clavibacter michiganensis subsp. michiganensis]
MRAGSAGAVTGCAARTARPHATRSWNARNAISCDRLTISSGVHPAAPSARRASGLDSRGRITRRCAWARAAARRGPTAPRVAASGVHGSVATLSAARPGSRYVPVGPAVAPWRAARSITGTSAASASPRRSA